MNKNGILISILIILALIIGGAYLAFGTSFAPFAHAPTMTATSTPSGVDTQVAYGCDAGKTISAHYTENEVALTISDGRLVTLPQVMSGSGIRYEANVGGTDVTFESKGNNAFLTENGKNTITNCVANSGDTASSGDTKTFTDGGKTFSFMYPSQFSVTGGGVGYSTSWMNNATTSGLLLATLQVPKSFQPTTNFGDATFTVGTSADPSAVATCLTYNPSGGPATASVKKVVNGAPYTVFTSSDAGAGNRYDTTSYRTVRNSQCYAIEYTVHSTNIQNYPAGTVTAFDSATVMNIFMTIIQSYRFL